MEYLEVTPGDIVEIKGKRTTAAVVLPADPEDAGKNIIRVDRITRENARVSIDGDVLVRKVVVKEAQSVTIAPVDVTLPDVQSFCKFIKNRILEAPVVIGDIIQVSIYGHVIRFRVIKTIPHGTVVITSGTDIQVLSEPVFERMENGKIQVWCVEDLDCLSVNLKVMDFEALFDGTVKVACELHLEYNGGYPVVATTGVLEFRWREEALSELDGFVNTLSRMAQEELEKIKADLARILANVEPVKVDMDRLLNKLIEALRNRIPEQNTF
jgi:hypothetical protein